MQNKIRPSARVHFGDRFEDEQNRSIGSKVMDKYGQKWSNWVPERLFKKIEKNMINSGQTGLDQDVKLVSR